MLLEEAGLASIIPFLWYGASGNQRVWSDHPPNPAPLEGAGDRLLPRVTL